MLENLRLSFETNKKLWIAGGIIGFLVITLGILLIVNNQPQQIQTIGNPQVTLTWWKSGYSKNTGLYNKIIEDFRKIPGNSSVTIRVENRDINDNYYRGLISDIARGIGPDIFSLQNDDLPAYKEFLSPIEVFRGSLLTEYRQSFVNLAVRETMDRDKVFGITDHVDNLQLYYNKNLLAQNRIPQPAKSWIELTRQSQFLSKRPIGGDNFITSSIALGTGGRSSGGDSNIPLHPDIIPMLIFQNGGQLFDYQTQKNILTESLRPTNQQNISNRSSVNQESPAFQALRFYLDFADPTTNRYSWNNSNPKAEDMFLEGRLAYIIQYRSFADEIRTKNSRLDFDVTELPQVDENNKRTFGRFTMDVLNRNLANSALNTNDLTAANKYQKAQEFMYYLSTAEAQETLAVGTGLPSGHRQIIQEQLEGDQATRIFAAGSLYAENYYKPDVDRTRKMWSDLFDRVQFSNVPLSESISQMSREYDLIIQSGPQLRR